VPYLHIAAAAVIPALLYYTSLFLMVDFEAARTGIKGVPADELPTRRDVLRQLHLFIPLFVLVGALVWGYSPMRSAFYAILATLAVSWIRPEHRLTPQRIFEALEEAGKRTVMMAVATGVAGIVVGIVTHTGLGLNFVGLVSSLSGGITFIGLVLVAIATIVLGMSVPTTVAYIIVAAVSVPALRALGFELLPAHMFAFYFAVISMITPPVAPASLAASEIAGANFFQTGFTAMKIGAVSFIIPFMFVYSPQLLGFGTVFEILIASGSALLGVAALTAGLHGWLLSPLKWWERFSWSGVGLMMINPGSGSDLIGVLGGLALAAGIVLRKRKLVPGPVGK
jgi:TRAP transporter 4TM/12TM fusion protein